MSSESLRTAGIILVVYPTVVFGGVSILWLWITRRAPYYRDNPLRQRLWTAGHAHAGVLLILSLAALLLVDQTRLSAGWQEMIRWAFPLAAILLPAAYSSRCCVLVRNGPTCSSTWPTWELCR